MTSARLRQPSKPPPSIQLHYPQKPPPSRQIPIAQTSQSAEPKRPAVSSPEACPTPADRVRRSRPATADVRQPLTKAEVGGDTSNVRSWGRSGHTIRIVERLDLARLGHPLRFDYTNPCGRLISTSCPVPACTISHPMPSHIIPTSPHSSAPLPCPCKSIDLCPGANLA